MERASRLFDRLIVGVGVNLEKETMFAPEERVDLIRGATGHSKNLSKSAFFPAWPSSSSGSAALASWSAACVRLPTFRRS